MPAETRALTTSEQLRRIARRLLGQPDLHWVVLPPYELPGLAVIGGVLVQNLGRVPAHNVKIDLSFPRGAQDIMREVQVHSDDEYIVRGGGEGRSFTTLRLRTLRPGGTVVVYYSSHAPLQPVVRVSHYEAE